MYLDAVGRLQSTLRISSTLVEVTDLAVRNVTDSLWEREISLYLALRNFFQFIF